MSSTQFVEMYHPLIPSTEVTPARVPVQAIDENAARGWLLVDPDGVLPTPSTPYYTKEALLSQIQGGADPIGTALRAEFVPRWQPNTAYAANEIVLSPAGLIVQAKTTFTSGTSYSASNWNALSGIGGAANDASVAALIPGPSATATALDAGYAKSGEGRTPPDIGGVGFPLSTIDAPSDGKNYASFPATVETYDGGLLSVWRTSSAHNFANPGDAGKLYISRSVGGITWKPRAILFDETPTYDLRDPCLYRAPGTRRVFLSATKFAVGSDNTPGLFIAYSDDSGYTFTALQSVRASTSAGAGPRRMSDGTWRWPAFEKRDATNYRAILLTATDPLGAWTKQANLYEDLTGSTSESDIVEISSTNWVGVVRGDGTNNQAAAVQSTDQGATWSAPTDLPLSAGSFYYQGWPTFLKMANGRIMLFARVSGSGLRVIELVDQAAPLTAASWREPGINGVFGDNLTTSGGGFVGKFVPIETGGTIRGAYMHETTADLAAEIRFGGFSTSAMNMWTSHIPTVEKTADGAAVGFVALPTPDTLTFWTPGGMHRIEYQTRSFQVSGAVSNHQHDIAIDGTLQGTTAQWYMPVTGSTVSVVNASYPPAGRFGYKWLARGKHTVQLQVRQDTTTVGRTYADRTLTVQLVGG